MTDSIKRQENIKKNFWHKNYTNFFLSIIVVLGFCICNIYTAFLFKSLIDTAIYGTLDDLKRLIITSFIFLIVYFLITTIKTTFLSRFVSKAMIQYKKSLLENIIKKKLDVFNKQVTGSYISILTNDIVSIETNYVLGVINIINQIMLLVIGMGTMLFLNKFLTVCVLVAAIVPLLASLPWGKKLSKVETDISEYNSVFVAGISDIFRGFSVIKSFKAEKEILDIVSSKNEYLEKTKQKRRMLANMVNVTLFSSSFLVTVVVCGVGAYLSITKVETLGTVVAFVQLLDYVVQPLQELGMLISNFKASSKLVENHQKMADSKEDIWKGQIKKKELNHSIKFANVSFGYGNEAVLKDITVEFKKGCSYAVVGNSGSGKSTLLSMLQGCHDNYNGTIHIDDVELREIQVESFYDLVTIVQQNVFLFDDTIYKNITMYKEFPDQKVDKSINKAGLNELIENRGKLYPCGENGRKLSGGEKQKVSIARALLSEAPIMLMDEVTSALDSISEKAIMNTICELQGLTRIIVTHSMKENHLKNFDNIIVMRDGKIEDIGKYDALYDRKGYFYSLVNLSGNNLTGG